jgi:hypothetical protein
VTGLILTAGETDNSGGSASAGEQDRKTDLSAGMPIRKITIVAMVKMRPPAFESAGIRARSMSAREF